MAGAKSMSPLRQTSSDVAIGDDIANKVMKVGWERPD